VPTSVGPLSPHNEALYETGKEIMKNSLSTGRDFCSSMITISSGAIPVYLGLLGFVLPENFEMTLSELVLSVVPPFVFLVSALVFVFGYLPKVGRFSLNVVEEIEQAYESVLKRRKNLIMLGVALFSVGSILAIASVTIHILS
jgi:MFS family permease